MPLPWEPKQPKQPVTYTPPATYANVLGTPQKAVNQNVNTYVANFLQEAQQQLAQIKNTTQGYAQAMQPAAGNVWYEMGKTAANRMASGMGVDYIPGAREAAREETIAMGKNIGTVAKDVRYRGGISKNPNPNENLFDRLDKVKEVTVGDSSARDADSARWNAMYGQYQQKRVKDAESQRLRGQAEKFKLDRTREINYAMQYYGKYLQWLQQQAAAAETANTGYGGYGYGRGYGYGGGGGGYYRSGGSAYQSPWYMNMLSWRI